MVKAAARPYLTPFGNEESLNAINDPITRREILLCDECVVKLFGKCFVEIFEIKGRC